ncbi:MAG: PQQ-binding-like beta-propeller repeat protein [Chloroflexi bacterium]|nr:PQQ-binding-like beta-propeller repeat protein [Chloroflexota bacterium]
MNRKIIPFAVAGVLTCLVMAVSTVFAFSGSVKAEKVESDVVWSSPFSGAESMKVIDLTGDGKDDLFVQSPGYLTALNENGEALFGFGYEQMKTTLGDVTGDNVEDIVVYHVDAGMSVDVINQGQPATIADTLNIGVPSRVAVIRFASGPQIVLGDSDGNLLALDSNGQVLWTSDFAAGEVRGMDDVRIGGQAYVAIASHDGTVAVFDSQGGILWQSAQEQLRRMRAFDLNSDGTGEIITGGEYGAFKIYDAANGGLLFEKSLGQAVSEVREVELDGNPSSREIVAGGKEGGIWAFSFDGATARQMWSASLSDKITEIAGIDVDDDGKQEAVVGDDSGKVAIFTANGTRHNLPDRTSGIARMDVGKLGNERYVIVADLNELQVNKISFSSIPGFQFTPLIVGGIISAVILIIAAILASIPGKPEMKVAFQDTSLASLSAQRRMLKESIADVERLRQAGEVTGEAYLARLKRLRADLADNEAAFKKQGYNIKVETVQCPNCGGTLELGMDKCEYCGQVLLS